MKALFFYSVLLFSLGMHDSYADTNTDVAIKSMQSQCQKMQMLCHDVLANKQTTTKKTQSHKRPAKKVATHSKH